MEVCARRGRGWSVFNEIEITIAEPQPTVEKLEKSPPFQSPYVRLGHPCIVTCSPLVHLLIYPVLEIDVRRSSSICVAGPFITPFPTYNHPTEDSTPCSPATAATAASPPIDFTLEERIKSRPTTIDRLSLRVPFPVSVSVC
jgi:hypothetical protein